MAGEEKGKEGRGKKKKSIDFSMANRILFKLNRIKIITYDC